LRAIAQRDDAYGNTLRWKEETKAASEINQTSRLLHKSKDNLPIKYAWFKKVLNEWKRKQ
jgi:predicted CopG family antitoxin